MMNLGISNVLWPRNVHEICAFVRSMPLLGLDGKALLTAQSEPKGITKKIANLFATPGRVHQIYLTILDI